MQLVCNRFQVPHALESVKSFGFLATPTKLGGTSGFGFCSRGEAVDEASKLRICLSASRKSTSTSLLFHGTRMYLACLFAPFIVRYPLSEILIEIFSLRSIKMNKRGTAPAARKYLVKGGRMLCRQEGNVCVFRAVRGRT